MGHGHHHHHEDLPQAAGDVPAALDASIPDSELSPGDVSRRGFLRRAGLLGAAAAAGGALANTGLAHAHGDDDRGNFEAPSKPNGPGSGRGFYGNAPGAASFPGYPLESYRTWGGFDWMTSTVGGLWDSLLAEGKAWWISANSDSHVVYGKTAKRPGNTDFNANGFHSDPVYGQPTTLTAGDYWPGYYSRTHVGSCNFSYASVMDGLRAGRVWVDHGGLISGLDVQVRAKGTGHGVTLGDSLVVRRGQQTELVIKINLANTPNWANFVPTLARGGRPPHPGGRPPRIYVLRRGQGGNRLREAPFRAAATTNPPPRGALRGAATAGEERRRASAAMWSTRGSPGWGWRRRICGRAWRRPRRRTTNGGGRSPATACRPRRTRRMRPARS